MKRSILVRVMQKNRISQRYGYNLFFFKGFTRLWRLRNPTIVCKLGLRKPGKWLMVVSTGLRTRKIDGINSVSQLYNQAERGTPPFQNLFVLVAPPCIWTCPTKFGRTICFALSNDSNANLI